MTLIHLVQKKQRSLISDRLILKVLDPENISENYIRWLNDPEINQFLETRHTVQDRESISLFVTSINESVHSLLFGVYIKYNQYHIGNIKIGPINTFHQYADLSYFIGEKEYWGKGYATEAITLILDFSFKELGLNRVQAGCYDQNVGSSKALLKAGFNLEGINKAKFRDINSQWQDGKEFAILSDDFFRR